MMKATTAIDGNGAVHAPAKRVNSGILRGREGARRFLAFAVGLIPVFIHASALALSTGPYFPLTDGASWTGTIGGLSGYTVTVSPGFHDVNGYPTKRLAYSPVLGASYYSNDAAGIRLHREVLQTVFIPGCGTTDITATYSPPLLYAPGEAELGATYRSTGTALLEAPGCITVPATYTVVSSISDIVATTTVPLGTFLVVSLVIRVEIAANNIPQSSTQTLQLAPHVGVIKQYEVESGSTFELASTNIARTHPDPFSFNPVLSAPLGSQVVSNVIGITGTTALSPITISGGEYSISGGPWLTIPSSIRNGQGVAVRVTTPSVNNSSATAILTIGGVSATFTVNSPFVADTTPDALSFTPQRKVATGTSLTSDTITVTGINVAVPLSVSGGSYSVNGGTFTSGATTVRNGDSVTLRVTSPRTDNTRTCAVVSIGDVQAPFCVTTGPLGLDLREAFQLLLGD
jgi:hypothetical protein